MGNSESFDLISISDNTNKNTLRKKPVAQYQHTQSISSSSKTITSFDLNGIFRRINDDYEAEKAKASINRTKSSAAAVILCNPESINQQTIEEPTDQTLSKALLLEDKTESVNSRASFESSGSDSDYVDRRLSDLDLITVPDKHFVSVTLTKSDQVDQVTSDELVESLHKEESVPDEVVEEVVPELLEPEVIKEVENVDEVAIIEDEVDIINLEDKEEVVVVEEKVNDYSLHTLESESDLSETSELSCDNEGALLEAEIQLDTVASPPEEHEIEKKDCEEDQKSR